MIEDIALLFANEGLKIEEAKVFPDTSLDFWHSCVIDAKMNPLSGGFGVDRMQARKIAVSELLERRTFMRLMKSGEDVVRSWGLDTHPTGCGFAGGFDLENSKLRSVSEAVERWVMSQWIDERMHIPEIPKLEVIDRLDVASKYFVSLFDDVKFFEKSAVISVDGKPTTIRVGQTMAFKDGGIFPGSSAQETSGNIWSHALVESFRHLIGFRNNPVRAIFPDNKVHFFARNANVALDQIERAQGHQWPSPRMILQSVDVQFNGKFFVVRTLVDGWKDWSAGPLERFLY